MPTVDHWPLLQLKGESFSGDNQLDILDEIRKWLAARPDTRILEFHCFIDGDIEYITIFYE